MDDRSKLFDLNKEQKTRLLGLGLKKEPMENQHTADSEKSDLLLDLLATSLPVDPAQVSVLPDILIPLCQELTSVAGEPLGKLLFDSNTDVSTFKKIKDYAKDFGTSTSLKSDILRDVALTIYYAAIAGALVFHDSKITKNSYKELVRSFESLCKQEWISKDLMRLFENARQSCSKNYDEEGE